MKITDKMSSEYVAGRGKECPGCGGVGVVGDCPREDDELMEVSKDMQCEDCLEKWVEVYTLGRIEETDK